MGFPVAEVTAHHWAKWEAALKDAGKELDGELMIDGRAPKCGQMFKNTGLAQTLKVNPQVAFISNNLCYSHKKETEQCRSSEKSILCSVSLFDFFLNFCTGRP